MTARLAPSGAIRYSGTAIAGLLLLGAWTGPAHASSGVDSECPEVRNSLEVSQITAPALAIQVVDHAVSSSAEIDEKIDDTKRNANSEVVPELSAATRELLQEVFGDEEQEDADVIDEADSTPSELPPTATRLPGVSEEELPRFRRQMYRTDI